MGPTRTGMSRKAGESSSSVSQTLRPRRKRTHKDVTDSTTLPGVQRLKSSLRQTRRLLAKDTLAADVRVETERRLKALEADIAQAESARKERIMSVRYHKVKFFERQKVVRKINQMKKQLAADAKSASNKGKAQALLSELRVDLNYILYYPKTKKYISLFPPEARQRPSEVQSTISKADTVKTDALRDEVRKWIRDRMDKGELQMEPELHLDAGERSGSKKTGTTLGVTCDAKSEKGSKGQNAGNSNLKSAGGRVEADAFFGDDDTEEGMDEDEDESG
ncbi:hypothetical protein PILCRDRAFT_461102 [Piloderma croceum F 1598]|uniref:rRNA-processing protein EFG1 n=1 Tax=Piloderma croceum (strain F 1598) TaxID=765440 RepID=A0A0C3BYD5_PILCF|nr:hypothetical protein PILCRDRAFT_461102 [Piloderma croceum F 1598]